MALLVLFSLQIVYGIMLIVHPYRVGALDDLGYVLVASLLIGIGRAWELVGDWNTGLFASVGVLIGLHPPRQGQTSDEPDSEDRLSEPGSADRPSEPGCTQE